MEFRSIVKEKETGNVGVVSKAETPYFPEDTNVTWVAAEREGKRTPYFSPDFDERFEKIGMEEPQPAIEKCSDCIFLATGPNGLTCERFGSLHSKLVEKAKEGKMRSTKIPIKLFPDCQLPA